MNIISKKEQIFNGNQAIVYNIDDAVRSDNIQIIIKSFEDEYNKMGSCHISGYSDSGSVSDCTFYDINELEQLNDFPSPYMIFNVDYINKITGLYSFSIKASSNDNRIFTFVDQKKIKTEDLKGRSR